MHDGGRVRRPGRGLPLIRRQRAALPADVARAVAREPEAGRGARAGGPAVASAAKRISAGALGGGSSASSGGSWSATQLATMRTSSTSSAGTTVRPGGRASAARVRSTSSECPGSGPQSTSRPRTSQNASKRSLTGAWRAPAGAPSASRAARPRAAPAPTPAARAGAAARRRARSGARRPPRACAGRSRRPAPRRRRALEVAEREVDLAAVGVRVEVPEAGRHAAAHLPVGRRVLAQLERAAAVAQPVERGELVGQLAGERPRAERARR